jgi:hypothetical protein
VYLNLRRTVLQTVFFDQITDEFTLGMDVLRAHDASVDFGLVGGDALPSETQSKDFLPRRTLKARTLV